MTRQYVETIVIGGGQAGLSVGYHLKRRNLPFVILDAHPRIGDAWRRRWESLQLFTPAEYDALPGMPFPADPNSFPTKDEMADYLESYATKFALPVRTGVRVESVSRAYGGPRAHGPGFIVTAGETQYEARNVIIAMSAWQRPRVPAFAKQLDPAINQLHSLDYHEPSQFRAGDVLVVGAGNSGGEIALDAARAGHRTWLSGRDNGHIPFRIDGLIARLFLRRFLLRVVFHRLLTGRTALGRKRLREFFKKGQPWIRMRPEDMVAAGVERVARVTGVRDGKPVLEDGTIRDVANVVWCTGFQDGLSSWVQLPVFKDGEAMHERGVAAEPGLYFVGARPLYAASSAMVQGADRDAEHVVKHLAARRVPDEADGVPHEPAVRRRSLSAIERVLVLGLGIGAAIGG
jgi:putative flavoprotein involved in K+ transport